jgi:hypothetical protein
MAYGTINADLMTTSDGVSSSGLYGFKNRIINGAMVIDQRATSIDGSTYSVDRWEYAASASAKATVGQSTTAATGFINSLLATSSSAYSISSSDYFIFNQKIEGLNCADLGWGTANAQTVTLSFWVRSSLTGTFGGSLRNSAANRSYPFSYTISSANTWEQKSVTITGDTSGTWLTTNGIGIRVAFGFGVGSTYSGTAGSWTANNYFSTTGATSVVGTNGATFYITGVQLEKGSTATSFDYRPYGTELALCQRYFQKVADGTSNNASYVAIATTESTTALFGMISFQVPMRTAPSLALTATSFRANMGTVNANSTTAPTLNQTSTLSTRFDQAGYTGLTADRSGIVRLNTDTGYVAFSAEL